MKFAMIFEGIDRATKVMNKIMAVEKATSGAMAGGAAKVEKASRAAQAATVGHAGAMTKLQVAAQKAFAMVQSSAAKASQAVQTLHQKTVTLGKAGLGRLGSGVGKVFGGMKIAAGMGALAVGKLGVTVLAAGKLVGVASQFEKFQTILETTEGSSAKAQKAMDWVTQFTTKTPYELEEVMNSFTKLRAYGLDPTKGLMTDLGNMSSAMGTPLMQAAEAIADAMTGENERLKEFGIVAAQEGNQVLFNYVVDGQKKVAKAMRGDPGGIQKALQKIMQDRFGGAMEKSAGTWDNILGNISDIWTNFELAIMRAGLFDWMKGKLQGVLGFLDRMQANGTFDAWAKGISDRIIAVLESAWSFGERVWQTLEKLASYLRMFATYVGGWENLAMIFAGLAVAPTLIATAAGIVQIVTGLAMLGTALAGLSITGPILAMGAAFAKVGVAMKAMGALALANPVVLIAAAIAGAAVAIWYNWEPIKAFFLDLWPSVSAGASKAWEAVKGWFGFDPVAALSKGWPALAGVVAAAWAALPSLSWDSIMTALDWLSWVHPLRWLDFVPGFSWAGVISGALDWGAYIVGLDWTKYLPAFSWSGLLTALDWASWVLPIRWLDFVPGFSWAGVISGALDWGAYIVGLDWTKYLPSFEWPDLPAFSWPSIPAFVLPALPDLAGWIGTFGDRAMQAIEAVSSRLGNAWAKVKSAFSFDETKADITVTDPATIRATAAATAALKADMQAVAGIDTSGAMDRLSVLERAAAQVLTAVTGSIQKAQAFMAGVSFYNQGAALMDTMAAGIRARSAVVIAEVQRVAQMMRDHLPSSPAKVGPLSDIHRLKFGETIARSIRPEPMVKAMRAAALATMGAAAVNAPAMAAPEVTMAQAGAVTAGAVPPSPAGEDTADAARAQVASVAARSQTSAENQGSATGQFVLKIEKLEVNATGNAADVQRQVEKAIDAAGRRLFEGWLKEHEHRQRRTSV